MKKVGIIGGLSPESTITYYKGLNEGVNRRLGDHQNAKILLSSLNFGEFVDLKEKGDWDTQADILCDEAQALERAGADFIVLATNTMHKMADQITANISIPFLHLADATAEKILEENIQTIGLLGTRYTMEQDFYKDRLKAHNVQVVVPEEKDRTIINDIIYNELCKGVIKDDSRAQYLRIIKGLVKRGAQGVILGCTEIALLVKHSHTPIPLFDTTQIHIEKALDFIFE
ncbi:MAG: aspartate/glutamate racemase family protein [Micavibrio sp.]|nr:aspartate/glutamate racemase family protein [Micavibrio sp.]